jgi:hypothetical protein
MPLVFLLASAGLAAHLQAEQPALTITPAFVTDYMFRGVRLAGPAFQPTAEVAYGSLRAEFWATTPLKNGDDPAYAPEFDPRVAYAVQLSESISLEPGIIGYVFPNARSSDGYYDFTIEPFLSLNWEQGGWLLTPTVYYDAMLEGPTFELAAEYELPFKLGPCSFQLSAAVGSYSWKNVEKNARPAVENWGSYYRFALAIPIGIGPHLNLVPGVAFEEGFSNYFKSKGTPREPNPDAISRVVGSLALEIVF